MSATCDRCGTDIDWDSTYVALCEPCAKWLYGPVYEEVKAQIDRAINLRHPCSSEDPACEAKP